MKSSLPQPHDHRIEQLESHVDQLYRRRPRQLPNLREHTDVVGYGQASGHALVYDATSSRWKPVLAPPTLRFNLNGAVAVSSSDEDVMASDGKVFLAKARLKTAGSSTTTAILKHGASATVATFTFGSGARVPASPPTVSKVFAEDDYFWVDVTAAGSGAEGLVINVWAMAK